MNTLDFILALCMGIGLSAAVGFRVFVPVLIISLASLNGYLTLADSFSWIGTYPALIAVSIATIIEISAYYIPIVDNLLDTLSVPIAAIAGVIITASFISDINPLLSWTLAVVTGGSTATVSNLSMAAIRGISTTTTGGLGNFIVSTFEWVGALLVSLLALVLPVLTVIVLLVVAFIFYSLVRRAQIKRRPIPRSA